MPAPVTIKNAVDTWTNQAQPSKSFEQTARIKLRNSAGADRHGWMFFTRPWPDDANIVSAKLQVWNGDNWSSSVTLTVHRVGAKWGINRINHNNAPAIVGIPATMTKSSADPGTLWNIDVTSLIQAVANGGAWYGFRITTSASFFGWLHSSESNKGKLRPRLVVEWTIKADIPDMLKPAGNRAVSIMKPVFGYDFNDTSGEDDLVAQQVQFGASEELLDAGTTTWDSGEVSTSSSEFDSSATAWPGLADGASSWWRVQTKDSAGVWSGFSDAVQFRRVTKGNLSITSGGLFGLSPVVTWALTGRTQRAYQVAIAPADSPSDWLWDSGKITGTETSVTIPFETITDLNITYVVIVRVWDTEDREATPGDPAYTEATLTSAIQYDSADSSITGLSMVSDPLYPFATLTWYRSGSIMPSAFVILRSTDSGTTWEPVMEVLEEDALVAGNKYEQVDVSARPYENQTWKVIPVASTNGRMTTGSLTVNGSVRRLAPFLYRKDGSDVVCFLNPERSQRFMDVQEVIETLNGRGVLVTQRLGKRTGTVAGRLTSEALDGVTAKQMFKRFMRLREDSGSPVYVAIANDTIKAVAYNFWYDIVTDTSGITYQASFDWVEL